MPENNERRTQTKIQKNESDFKLSQTNKTNRCADNKTRRTQIKTKVVQTME